MDRLIKFNRQGLFPAPMQTDESFWNKVDRVIPHLSQALYSSHCIELLQGFDIDPSWVPLFDDDRGIHLWEGAVLWQQETGQGFTLPEIQLSSRSHRFCSRDELIAHESIHAVRVDFKEDKFEEILAYATSLKAWRRWLGPLFRTPRETMVFLGAVVASLVLQVFACFSQSNSMWLLLPWLPLSFLLLALARLTRAQSQFKRCQRHLSQAVKDPKNVMAVLLRLSDEEIEAFSRMDSQKIKEWVGGQQSLRWKMIAQCYFH